MCEFTNKAAWHNHPGFDVYVDWCENERWIVSGEGMYSREFIDQEDALAYARTLGRAILLDGNLLDD